jgi:hypothetical protein
MGILETILPAPAEFVRVYSTISQPDKGGLFSVLLRLILIGFILVCVRRRKFYTEYLATFIALVLLGAGIMIIGFQESGILLFFPPLFVLGLLWGREALILPPHPKASSPFFYIGAAFGLAACFYPYFAPGLKYVILVPPLGVLPAPSILIALAAAIATRRTYSVYALIPTWVMGAVFGLLGVFYIHKPIDWILLAAVPVAMAAYYLSPTETPRHKSKKLKRH